MKLLNSFFAVNDIVTHSSTMSELHVYSLCRFICKQTGGYALLMCKPPQIQVIYTLNKLKGVLHPRPVFGLFLHFSQKLQHIGNK